jgi:hypothetical protein
MTQSCRTVLTGRGLGWSGEPTMNKMDELRAMREAKYARAKAGATPKPRPKPVPVAPDLPEAEEPAEPPSGLCGHRSMNGRTCTREAGHAAKSHRYS